MGNSECEGSTPRMYTTPAKSTHDPISSMQGKVLMGKEQLRQDRYSSSHKTSATSPGPRDERCSDLYSRYLSQRTLARETYNKTAEDSAGKRIETVRECTTPKNRLETHINSKYLVPTKQTETDRREHHRRYASHAQNKNHPGTGDRVAPTLRLSLNPTTEEIKSRNSLEKEGFRVEEVIEDVRRRLILTEAESLRPSDMPTALSRPMKPPSFDRVSLLPANILFRILAYGVDGFRIYLCVNPSWYCGITDAFNERFNATENRFVNMYFQHLSYKDSYTSSSLMKFCDTMGTRIDRVIKCETLPTTRGRAVTFSYTYRYLEEPTHVYRASFRFDSVKSRTRVVWAYLNECKVSSPACLMLTISSTAKS